MLGTGMETPPVFPTNHYCLSAVSIFKSSTLCTEAQGELIENSASAEKS